jgi:hypothetical protein
MATFGQRGVAASAAFNRPVPVSAYEEPSADGERNGLLGSFLKSSDDHLDVDFGTREDYAPGKTLWIAVPLWFFLGGMAAHRFYLGHWKYALSMNLAWVIAIVMLAVSLTTGEVAFSQTGGEIQAIKALAPGMAILIVLCVWAFFDGVYVIVRMLTSGR